MQVIRRKPRHKRGKLGLTALLTIGAVTLAACGGGPSDSTTGETHTGDGSKGTLRLFAYAVPQVGYDKIVPAFAESDQGRGVRIEESYGASGDQSRKVANGAPADIVNFSVAPDITRLVQANLVDPDWDKDATKGIPFGSVVVIAVRKGNPKNIHTWDDLLKPGVEVVTPNPFSSGSAKWNLLAPYAAKSDGGKNQQAGLDYLSALIKDHLVGQPKSGRDATELFSQGTGDVLLSYENEALFIERQGKPVEHMVPEQTLKIENAVAVVKTSADPALAARFRDFLYTPRAQELWAEAGFRPVDPGVAAKHTKDFPEPEKLWTIDELGGWGSIDSGLFAQKTGKIAAIYDAATK